MADTASEAEQLIALMARYNIGSFEHRDDLRSIRIVNGAVEKELASVPLPAATAADGSDTGMVRSPAVGRFRRANTETMPLAAAKGEILGFIISGSLRLPVTAGQDCLLLSACHPDDTPVGYDTPLFTIRLNS